jgi:hypothetical protein
MMLPFGITTLVWSYLADQGALFITVIQVAPPSVDWRTSRYTSGQEFFPPMSMMLPFGITTLV